MGLTSCMLQGRVEPVRHAGEGVQFHHAVMPPVVLQPLHQRPHVAARPSSHCRNMPPPNTSRPVMPWAGLLALWRADDARQLVVCHLRGRVAAVQQAVQVGVGTSNRFHLRSPSSRGDNIARK